MVNHWHSESVEFATIPLDKYPLINDYNVERFGKKFTSKFPGVTLFLGAKAILSPIIIEIIFQRYHVVHRRTLSVHRVKLLVTKNLKMMELKNMNTPRKLYTTMQLLTHLSWFGDITSPGLTWLKSLMVFLTILFVSMTSLYPKLPWMYLTSHSSIFQDL